jgi:hypothetical protein
MLKVYNELFLKVDLTNKRGRQTFSTSEHLLAYESGKSSSEKKPKPMTHFSVRDETITIGGSPSDAPTATNPVDLLIENTPSPVANESGVDEIEEVVEEGYIRSETRIYDADHYKCR